MNDASVQRLAELNNAYRTATATTTEGENMSTKARTKKTTDEGPADLANMFAGLTAPKPRAHRKPATAKDVAAAREDMLPEVSAITDDSEIAEELERLESAPIDREALRKAKIKAACEADYRVIAVLEHAKANYNEGGWDIVLETMTVIDIYWVIYKARSSAGAIKRMAEHVGPIDAHRAEITNA